MRSKLETDRLGIVRPGWFVVKGGSQNTKITSGNPHGCSSAWYNVFKRVVRAGANQLGNDSSGTQDIQFWVMVQDSLERRWREFDSCRNLLTCKCQTYVV